MNKDEFLWTEKYRPHTVGQCILPERLIKSFKKYVKDGQIPNLMLTGTAGTGKTTVAKAMCEETGVNHMVINSSDERGIDTLRNKIKNYASTMSLTGGRKVIILDEADYLTPEAQAGLRAVMEEFSDNCTFIFTCNFKGRLIDALHSRCSVIDFKLTGEEKTNMATRFFRKVELILEAEKVEFERSALAFVVNKYFPDYRRTLNELQRLAGMGPIDAGSVAASDNLRKLADLMKALKEKDFGEMRKWVVTNSDVDPATIYRTIYNELNQYFEPASVPQAVIIIAQYQYWAAFVADQEINLCACLTQIMVDCEFKDS
jgi:replication factor C small subunit